MIRLESTPHNINKDAVKDALYLDKILFPSDTRSKLKESYVWVVRHRRKPVGFAGLKLFQKPGEVYGMLSRAGILPTHEGRGLHKKLIRKRLALCSSLGLKRIISYTLVDNYISANNLIRCGFKLYWPDPPWAGSKSIYWVKYL